MGNERADPKKKLSSLVLPAWYPAAQERVLSKIRNAKTVGDFYDAIVEEGQIGRRLSHDLEKQRPPGDPRTLYEATLAQNPADAPLVVKIEPALQKEFAALFQAHLDEGSKKERGGTLVVGTSGEWKLVNTGRGGKDNFFLPNLDAGDSSVVGTFHTHVDHDRFSSNANGISDTAHGGGDIAHFLENKLNVSVLNAGNKEFMLLRTESTPANVDGDKVRREYKDAHDAGSVVGRNIHSSEEVTQRLAREYAQKYQLAYYEGKDGVFTRVTPPP